MGAHLRCGSLDQGAEVLLAKPLKVKLASKTTLKTDRVDSAKLALLARLNAIPEPYAHSPHLRALRRPPVRERVFYHAKWKAVASHTYAILLQKCIPHRPEILTRRRLRAALWVHDVPEVSRGLDALEKIEEISIPLDREIHRAFLESKEAQLLSSIPVGGEFTWMTLVAFRSPLQRFYSLDAVVKYCGLCPPRPPIRREELPRSARLGLQCDPEVGAGRRAVVRSPPRAEGRRRPGRSTSGPPRGGQRWRSGRCSQARAHMRRHSS